jgi:hypothetical protein
MDDDDQNIEVPTGSLNVTTYPATVTLIQIVRYLMLHPLWGIVVATSAALGLIIGAAVGGSLGAILGGLLVLIGGYASTRHRTIKEIHTDIKKD